MDKEEAIEIIRKNMPSDKSLPVYEALQTLVPELAESEDEKARKWIYDFIRNCPNESFEFYGGVGKQAVLAWLGKQKENTWSEEDDAKVKAMCEEGNLKPSERAWLKDLSNRVWKEQKPADQGVKGRRGRIGNTPEHIRKKAENFLSKMEPPYDADDICSAYETGAIEKANPSWSEEDEKVLNSIIAYIETGNIYATSKVNMKVWLKSLRPQKQEWGEFDEGCLKRAIWYAENPAPSVVKDTNLTLWLQSLPERFNLQPKQEWSEEDEDIINAIIDDLCSLTSWIKTYAGTIETGTTIEGIRNHITWLKSLRPSWRPSEEHLSALLAIFNDPNNIGSQTCQLALTDLYEQLKRLM